MSKKPPKRTPAQPSHGGRRPGAGAPPGNLNALRHGARSELVHTAVSQLLEDPYTGQLLMALLTVVTGNKERSRIHLRAALTAATQKADSDERLQRAL